MTDEPSALIVSSFDGSHLEVTPWDGAAPVLVECGTEWDAWGLNKPAGPWHLIIKDASTGDVLFDEKFEDKGVWSVHVKGDQVLLRRAGEPGLSDPIPNAYACANAGPLPTLAVP